MTDIEITTDFLDRHYHIITVPQRKWHIRNLVLDVVMCQICNITPAKFHQKSAKYLTCSKECAHKLISIKTREKSSPEKTKKQMETMIENHGPDVYNKIYEKVKKTNLKKYGTENPAKSEQIKVLMKKSYDDNFIKNVLPDNYEYLGRNDFHISLKHMVCQKEFSIPRGTFDARKSLGKEMCIYCSPRYANAAEDEISVFLDSLGVEYKKNCRTIIPNKELDFYVPSLKMGIEYNSLYYHSDLFLENDYHTEKRRTCEQQGIRLFSIWEDEWVNNKDLIGSMIKGLLGLNTRIGARKTNIKQIFHSQDIVNFINNNHLQGYVSFSIGYGLYYKDELVQIMTFTKKKDDFEISRLCTKTGISIQGGANRIFRQFVSNHSYGKIISYCDLMKFTGKVYENLGSYIKSDIRESYYYIRKNGANKERLNRRNFQKSKLIEMGHDSSKTEKEIMYSMGYCRVYNAGNLLFVYENPVI